ncbi:glutamate ABC transporter substrate-binding protein [soil metagenome]
MRIRTAVAVLAVGAPSVALGGCAADGSADPSARIVIGVDGTTRGLSYPGADGTFSGFEVDVATYVARGLGWSPDTIELYPLDTDGSETALASGAVDMVVSGALSPADSQDVAVAGPYFVAGQDLLVDLDDAAITGPHSLDGTSVCSTTGSTAAQDLTSPEYSPGAHLRELPDTSACVTALLAGDVDAVTGDDLVLAAYAEQHPGRLKVLGSPLSTQQYDIGLPAGSPDVAAVHALLEEMVADGAWQASFDRFLGHSGLTPSPPRIPGGT